MVKKTTPLEKIRAAEDKPQVSKKFLEHKQSDPLQLSLFENLTGEEKETKKDYSRTIELYDFMPKYVWGKQSTLRASQNMPLEREFYCREKKYKLVIHPSAVKDEKNKEYKYYYPGIQEEIVEDVLRKLLIEKGGMFLDKDVAVKFSISQIRTELQTIGHAMNYYQIIKALQVLRKTNYELISDDEQVIFSPIMALGLKGKDSETQSFVIFSPLVTQSVKNLDFRLYNYRQTMMYSSVIARQLHKRLAHHFTQASIVNQYTINLKTIIRDFGLTAQKSLGKNVDDVVQALEEMKSNDVNVILLYKYEKVFEKRKLIDVKFSITPTNRFSQEIKKANYFENEVKNKFTEIEASNS